MSTKNPKINQNNPGYRRKRIQRMKTYIVIIVMVLLILPTILCLILFSKISNLEKELKILKVIHESEYEEMIDQTPLLSKKAIAYAANKEDVIQSEQDYEVELDKIEEITELDSVNDIVQEQEYLNQKKVYFTFDDGPSIYTDDILDILKEYQIKATFFVVGKTDDYSKSMYQRIVEEGHTLGLHSYSHRYSEIYHSMDNFIEDVTKLSDLLQEVTGEKLSVYRFPGGSSNEISKNNIADFIEYLNDKNITYYDWNVINGDATGKKYSTEELIDQVLEGVKGKNTSIVLMHDAPNKSTTVESLPQLIESLLALDYNICPIDEYTTPIQHIKAETLR